VNIAGKDMTDVALEKFIEMAGEEWEVESVRNNMIVAMKSLRMMLNGYLQYYYATDAILQHIRNKLTTRGEDVVEVEKTLFPKYSDLKLDQKPEELSKRGGAHYSTAAFHLIDAIENNTGNRQIVCCRNGGAVPTFDDDASLELPAVITSEGAKPVPQPAPEPVIRGLMQTVKAYETMTVQAAVTGDRETAFQAMLLHPLMPGAVGAKRLLEELLEINRQHLQGVFF
jgi:6-phospho-beta-glucosidase